MTELPRLVLAREHIHQGLTPKMLARRCSSGALVRLRHGVYVDGEAWGSLQPWEQYRLKIQAAAETFAAPTVFAWQSAAAAWGVPTVGHPHSVHAPTFQNDGGRSRAGVSRHYADPAGVKVFRHDGLLVSGRVRTVLDLAEGNYTPAAARRITEALEFADPLAAFPGESYSRALIHAAGFETPVLQYEIRDGASLIGYSDYYWDGARVAGEFDGDTAASGDAQNSP